MAKQRAKLDQWWYEGGRLHGHAVGHPRFKDGDSVVTSTVLSPPDSIKEGSEVETRNTIYTLGKKFKPAEEN